MIDRERAIGVSGRDRPQLSVADGLTSRGDEPSIVASGHHGLTDVGTLTVGDRCHGLIELLDDEAGVLDAVVEGVDLLVVTGGHGNGASSGGVGEPVGGDPFEVLVEAAGLDVVVLDVGVKGGGVACAKLE